MALPIPTPDSALSRGIRTFIQAVIGFVVGLFIVVWAVPGVPHAVITYVGDNWVQLALSLGIPSGVASFVWNLARSNVKNF